MTEETWQEVLWTLPSDLGAWWYVAWGVVGGIAAPIIYAVAIKGQPAGPMLLCRAMFCFGLVLIPLGALNSGWQPWIPAFYAASGLVGALSLAVERCDKEMEIVTVGGALLEKAKRAAAVLLRVIHRGSV